jgi:hypothetical protein
MDPVVQALQGQQSPLAPLFGVSPQHLQQMSVPLSIFDPTPMNPQGPTVTPMLPDVPLESQTFLRSPEERQKFYDPQDYSSLRRLPPGQDSELWKEQKKVPKEYYDPVKAKGDPIEPKVFMPSEKQPSTGKQWLGYGIL